MYILNAYNYAFAYVAAVMKYCVKACPDREGLATKEEEEEREETQAQSAH